MITWDTVYYDNNEPFLAQIQLLEDGTIILGFDNLNLLAGFNDDVLIGLSPGGGVTDPGSTDLTANMPFNSGTEATIYEFFTGNPPPIDLEQLNVFFTPNANGGWQVGNAAFSAPTMVPTLSQWALILLSLLLMGFGLKPSLLRN